MSNQDQALHLLRIVLVTKLPILSGKTWTQDFAFSISWVCKQNYDCRQDKRIWIDFEQGIPAPEVDI